MSHAHRCVHLTEQLQTIERLLVSTLSERAKEELRGTRSEILAERNDLMDAISFGVPDDSEGI